MMNTTNERANEVLTPLNTITYFLENTGWLDGMGCLLAFFMLIGREVCGVDLEYFVVDIPFCLVVLDKGLGRWYLCFGWEGVRRAGRGGRGSGGRVEEE